MPLTGVWMNELNSIMVLNENSDGSLTGKYRSIVGRDPNVRDLAGRTSTPEQAKQMLGFAVCFHIDNPGLGSGHFSLCTWSGWARDDKKITTHWLLTLNNFATKDEWASTLLGEDQFERVLAVPEEKHLTATMEGWKKLLSQARSGAT